VTATGRRSPTMMEEGLLVSVPAVLGGVERRVLGTRR
jgi:hypothetical protein